MKEGEHLPRINWCVGLIDLVTSDGAERRESWPTRLAEIPIILRLMGYNSLLFTAALNRLCCFTPMSSCSLLMDCVICGLLLFFSFSQSSRLFGLALAGI